MALTTEQFSSLLDANAPVVPGGREKRRAERQMSRTQAAMIPVVNGQPSSPVNVHIRDLSPRGVGLTHYAALERGSQFILRLARRGGEPLAMLCSVCHSRLSGGAYFIGAEFVCVYTGSRVPAPSGTSDIDSIRQKILG
jgi:PilZ domain